MYNTLPSLRDAEYPLDIENFEVIHQETSITLVFLKFNWSEKNLLPFNYGEMISEAQFHKY